MIRKISICVFLVSFTLTLCATSVAAQPEDGVVSACSEKNFSVKLVQRRPLKFGRKLPAYRHTRMRAVAAAQKVGWHVDMRHVVREAKARLPLTLLMPGIPYDMHMLQAFSEIYRFSKMKMGLKAIAIPTPKEMFGLLETWANKMDPAQTSGEWVAMVKCGKKSAQRIYVFAAHYDSAKMKLDDFLFELFTGLMNEVRGKPPPPEKNPS